jgi:hypothetical protein
MGFPDTHHNVQNEDEEVSQFREYYEIVLKALDVVAPTRMIDELAHWPYPFWYPIRNLVSAGFLVHISMSSFSIRPS